MDNKLKAVYDSQEFRKTGHELIDLLADYLSAAQNQEIKTLNWASPAKQLDYWENYRTEKGDEIQLFRDIIEHSIHIHHPRYMGHQVNPPAPIAALADLAGALLNNGMAVYEMGSASSAIEKVVTDVLLKKIGFDKTGDGYLTSGGTLANLTALLAARKAMTGTNNGKTEDGQKLAVMISAEAHYCVSRALRIMGFDEEGIVKVPVNEAFHLDTTRLEELYKSAVNKGFRVIAVVGSAPSTSTGMYDDIKAIGSFCRHHKIWFHLDGAHGGAVVFSEKYRHLANGIERADSVVIDAHKMLMTPALTTFLLFKNKVHSYSNFSQEAQYLWESAGDEEWYNYAKRTFECTKLMMSIKFFSILKIHGETVFDSFVTTLYDLGKNFAHQVKSRANFQLFLEPHSNIVCFRFFDSSLNEDALNKLNHTIRKEILEEGKFYLVQTSLHQTTYLRVTLMNPGTTPKIISELLDTIEETAKRFM